MQRLHHKPDSHAGGQWAPHVGNQKLASTQPEAGLYCGTKAIRLTVDFGDTIVALDINLYYVLLSRPFAV